MTNCGILPVVVKLSLKSSGRRRFRMNLKFRHKVFLAFLLHSLILVVCIPLIVRFYSERNFENYIRKVEDERITRIVDELIQEYKANGNWDFVRQDSWFWSEMRRIGPPDAPGSEVPGPPDFPPPPSSIEGKIKPPSPMGPEPAHPGPHPPGPPGPPFARGGPDGHRASPPIVLFDAERRPLTPGDFSSQGSYRLVPIAADSQVIGWLGVRKHVRPTHHLDVEFMRQQSQAFYATGAFALMFAVLVTYALARHLLAPVKELEKGARALSSRRFDTRIAVSSSDELGKLAAEFNAMAEALERYQQTQQQWLVDISHELRTPLAILRGEIEAMQDGVRTVTRQGLDSLHFEVLHLSRIVSDLHDLSSIESWSSRAEQEAVDLPEILTETLESFRTRLELRGIRVDADATAEHKIPILADGGRLKQLFSNLFENTLRYASAPGVLKIFIEAGSGEILVRIEDSGPGVPEESLPLIFDRLYRVDRARSRQHGGSGLGLAICKSIVGSFGGKIEASNSPEGGLRISMIFPRHLGLML
jgi:two-component system sensor histidine kinase BaeS